MRGHTVLLCAVIATTPAMAFAQSPLAEAAKKAEEQRRENAGQSQVFTDRDLQPRNGYDPDLYGTKLSLDGIERYSTARADMVRAMLADRQLDARVSQQTISDFRDYEKLLAAEPAFAERLARAGITAHDYVYTEGALTIAEKLATSGVQPSKDYPPAVTQNVGFYRVTKPTITRMLAEAKDLEKQLVVRRGGKKAGKK
jgi:hypothetical protein